MNALKKIMSDHTDSNKLDEEGYVLSLIEQYESFIKEVEGSGRPMWLLCYYDGKAGSHTKNTGDDSQRN